MKPSNQLFQVRGMTCASCVKTVEEAIKSVPGVTSASVNLALEQAQVEFSSDTQIKAISAAVEAAGYSALPLKTLDESQGESSRLELFQVSLALVLSLAVMISGMILGLSHWVEFFLSIPVLFYSGWPFLKGFYRSARQLKADMNTLVGLSTLTAFAFSTAITAGWVHSEHGTYFEVADFLVAFVLLGKFLEKRARRATGSAITQLIQLTPKKARVIRGGIEKEVSIDEVFAGDTVRILAAERLSVDGIVIDGQSSVDESTLTGESLPVEKKAGMKVFAGTVNQDGMLLIRTTEIGTKTVLAQMVELVRQAQASKAPIQDLADRISAVFVPIVLVIALLTAGVWWILGADLSDVLMRSISVLMISCPCALGLATPAAMVVGMGLGARKGILFRNAEAMERLSQVKQMVFDKTGTLTQNRPAISQITPSTESSSLWADPIWKSKTLGLIGSLEQASNHPLSKAFHALARPTSFKFFKSVPGQGVEGHVEGDSPSQTNRWLVGSRTFLESRKIAVPQPSTEADLGSQIEIAQDGIWIARISIQDEVRPEAQSVVQKLKNLGIELALLSGDRRPVVDAVSALVGIPNAIAESSPAQKAGFIRTLKEKAPTAMVGDGVNDAPALALADVGIALGKGTDIAIETAQVTLMSGDLQALPDAVRIARQTLKTVRQNLFASFIYNILGIPLAAGVFFPLLGWQLNPMVAGGAMALSSISVLLNSLRLNRYLMVVVLMVTPLLSEAATSRWVVQFKPDQAPHFFQSLADSQYPFSAHPLLDNQWVVVSHSSPITLTPQMEWIEPDAYYQIQSHQEFPNDPEFKNQWGMEKIGVSRLWKDQQIGSHSVKVAVIDTGIQWDHPDLAANLYTNPGESGELSTNGLDDDKNGYIDDVHGYAFTEREGPNPNSADDWGHGTHCAGIIGAIGNNGLGVTGVVWNVQLMPVKWLTKAAGWGSDAALAVDYARIAGAQILSNSWGGVGKDKALEAAIRRTQEAGILFVAAAGNYYRNIDQYPFHPASFTFENILSVAATDSQDQLASFSSYGPKSVHLAAPGEDILSTGYQSDYRKMSGTSMATPMVAGAAAMLLSLNPEWKAKELKAELINRSVALPSLKGKIQSGKRLAL